MPYPEAPPFSEALVTWGGGRPYPICGSFNMEAHF